MTLSAIYARKSTDQTGCDCKDGWICEQHPDRGWPHDDCGGPGVPCPSCNQESPPRLPSDWVTIARVDEKKGGE
jgi:hypothetical protein